MARDGVFTQIIYQAQGVAAQEVDRRGLIVGPPIRTEVDRQILVWEAAGEKLYVGSGPTDPDYETSQIIRPLSDDVIVNAGDIKFYLSKADGSNSMEMVAGSLDEIDKLVDGVVVAPADYKAQTRTELDELSQDHALVMKLAPGALDEVDITVVPGSVTEFDVADHVGFTALADGILNVAYGQSFRDGSANYAKVIAVNVSSGTIRVKKVDVGFGAVAQETGWDILCLLYTSPSPRDVEESRMPSSA